MGKCSLWLCVGLVGCAGDPGLTRRAESVVWKSMQSPDGVERLRATRLAAELADPALDRALPPRLVDPDPQVRAVAAVALSGQAQAALEVLARTLAGPDAAARAIAVDGVAHLADAARTVEALAADPDPGVRARVAATLANPPRELDAEKRAALLGRLAADADAGVRAQAVRAMRGRAVLPLVEAALADAALSVRLAALASLLGIDATPARLASLTSAGSSDANARFVALRAAVQLSRLGETARAVEAVRAAAADEHAAVRAAAMNAAGELGDAGAAVARASLHDRAAGVRLAAALALIATGHADEARATLEAALPDEDAAEALARLGDARGAEVLRAAIHSPHPAVRERALSRWARIAGSRTDVAGALADASAAVRLTAAGIVLRRSFR
jgi:HEAT repeat protein